MEPLLTVSVLITLCVNLYIAVRISINSNCCNDYDS